MVLNTEPLDWKTSALTNRSLLHKQFEKPAIKLDKSILICIMNNCVLKWEKILLPYKLIFPLLIKISFWATGNLTVPLKLSKIPRAGLSKFQVWMGIPDYVQLKEVVSEVSFLWRPSLCKKSKTLVDYFQIYSWSRNPAIWLEKPAIWPITGNSVY